MAFQDLFTSGKQRDGGGSSFLTAMVTKVVLGPYLADNKTRDPDYNDPTDIGTIRFIIANSKQASSFLASGNPVAKPLWSFLRYLPTENEYVYLIIGPSPRSNKKIEAQDFYYMPSFAVWNAPNHNALPLTREYVTYKSIEKTSYQENIAGTPNAPQSPSIAYPLGHNFPEKGNVKALRPFVGDFLLESRWGSSIRFGSSIKKNITENNWSVAKEDGDPIMMLVNGQASTTIKEGWVPVVEDINNDKSSIYLTSGQRIYMKDVQTNFSLTSFGVALKTEATTVKNLTLVPTSNDELSPLTVDNITNKNAPNTI